MKLSKKIYMAFLGLSLVFGLSITLSGPASAQVVCDPAAFNNQVDLGAPNIMAGHIFCGNVNAHGRSTGFHSRPGGVNPPTIVNVPGGPTPVAGQAGLYKLTAIEIRENNINGALKAVSTMYPDACDQDEVLAAVRNAANNAVAGVGPSGATCQTTDGNDFDIRFYLDGAGTVVTAYPNY